jgi:ABC-type glycerol-3-phosphate transport system substrate-binding protein
LLHSFTYNDPDDNGKDDTYGVALGGMYLRWLGFKDVFEANGCYLTYQYYFYEDNKIEANVVPVGYNPATNKIEDSVSKPGMKESLNFIASLIDNKIISPDYNYMNDGVFSNNRVGTYMGPVRNNIVYPERYEYVFALQGLMSEYTSSIFQDGGGAYFLSANSKNPSEIVPVFIDTFYGDEAGYEFARFGLLGEKNMYSKHNGVIQTNYPSGSLISNISLVGNLSWQKPNVYEHESDIQKTAIDIDKLLNLKGVYLLTQNQMSFGEKILKPYDGAEISIDTIYNGQISQAYYAFETGQVGVEDTYNELLRIHKLFHVDEWIEEINAKWIGND